MPSSPSDFDGSAGASLNWGVMVGRMKDEQIPEHKTFLLMFRFLLRKIRNCSDSVNSRCSFPTVAELNRCGKHWEFTGFPAEVLAYVFHIVS